MLLFIIMEEQWSLIDYQELIKSIINGSRNIQDPISISNKRRDTTSNISFLNHLLSYKNIHRENILEVLAEIYRRFLNQIEHLKDVQMIQKMMDRVNDEWYDPDYIFTVENPLSSNFFDVNHQNKVEYDRSCKVCNEVDQLCKIENNIPLKLNQGEKHPLEKHFQSSIVICTESIQYLQENLTMIHEIISHLKNTNMSQFIDLSIKHKSLYLKLNEGDDEEDDSIPENIHLIFSNYIHIHNLLLKQMIQYYHHINTMLEELKKECQRMKTMKQNVTSIAYLNQEDEEEEEEEDGEEDGEEEGEEDGEEENLTVVDGEVVSQKNEGNIFSTFF